MLLKSIIEKINTKTTNESIGNAEVANITADSRAVTEGSLFIAVKGFSSNGNNFIEEAFSKGAIAVVSDDIKIAEKKYHNKNIIVVDNSRKALSEIANIFYGEPSQKLTVIGITGTKGKTTTTYFIKNILESSGFKCGLIGTNANYIGNKKIEAKLTTPEATEIHYLLKEMLESGCTHCVMEASSHSIDLYRVADIAFDQIIFSNIANEHLDYHKTFENYLLAKKKIFDDAKPEAKVIINSDDNNWEKIVKDCKAKVITYGTSGNSDYKISDITYNLEGTKFLLSNQNLATDIATVLIGSFNADNAGAAFISGLEMGLDIEKVKDGIKNMEQVPGRFEVISNGEKKVIVDFAHTAGSLEKALEAVHHVIKDNRKIYTVMGCGGNRDKTKRPVMGEIAGRLSDKVFVTSDNPRDEDPYLIIEDVIKGINTSNYKAIEDRREAIRQAILTSEECSVILIAGKGHETYQIQNGKTSYFSDKETAIEFLKECKQ